MEEAASNPEIYLLLLYAFLGGLGRILLTIASHFKTHKDKATRPSLKDPEYWLPDFGFAIFAVIITYANFIGGQITANGLWAALEIGLCCPIIMSKAITSFESDAVNDTKVK